MPRSSLRTRSGRARSRSRMRTRKRPSWTRVQRANEVELGVEGDQDVLDLFRLVAGQVQCGQMRAHDVGAGVGRQVLNGVGLVRADDLADGLAGRDVLQDGDQVVLGEAPGRGGEPECLVDPVASQDSGEFDSVGPLGADPGRPGGSGLLQPASRLSVLVRIIRVSRGGETRPRSASARPGSRRIRVPKPGESLVAGAGAKWTRSLRRPRAPGTLEIRTQPRTSMNGSLHRWTRRDRAAGRGSEDDL